jgi:hypothetical protein
MKNFIIVSKLFFVFFLTFILSCSNCDNCINYELCEVRKCECPFYAYGENCTKHHFDDKIGRYHILSNFPGFPSNDTVLFHIDHENPRFLYLSNNSLTIKGIAQSDISFFIQQYGYSFNNDYWLLLNGSCYFNENEFEISASGKKNNQDYPNHGFSMVGYKL